MSLEQPTPIEDQLAGRYTAHELSPSARARLSEEIRQHVEAFLASGGTITPVPTGMMAHNAKGQKFTIVNSRRAP